MAQGAREAGREAGVKVVFRGPRSQDQHDAQIKIIEYGIRQGYDAIVLAPNHQDLIVPAVQKAVDHGIKVVLIDSDMQGRFHSSFVESDNYKAGQQAAHHAASLLEGTGNAVLIRFQKGHASTSSRESGFIQTIRSVYPRINLVTAPYAGPTTGSAYHTVSGILKQFAPIDLIFSVNEQTAVGALRAIRENRSHRQIKMIAFDLNPELNKALVDREIHATIIQNPYKIGYLGVIMAVDLIHGKRVPEIIHTETILITPENYTAPAIADLIRMHTVRSE